MAIVVEKGTYESNPMPEGLNEAIISEVFTKEMPKFGEPGKLEKKVIVRYVTAEGKEAASFLTPSLSEKANLTKILQTLLGEVPAKYDVEKLVGTQVRVLTTDKKNSKGQTVAKVEKVMKPSANQKVPMPAKKAQAEKPTGANPIVNDHGLTITDADIPF